MEWNHTVVYICHHLSLDRVLVLKHAAFLLALLSNGNIFIPSPQILTIPRNQLPKDGINFMNLLSSSVIQFAELFGGTF